MKFGVTPAGGAKAGKWVRGSMFREEERGFSFPLRPEDVRDRSKNFEVEHGSLYIHLFIQEPSESRMSLEVPELTCHWACWKRKSRFCMFTAQMTLLSSNT